MITNEAPYKIYLATTEEVQNLDNSFVGIAHRDPEDIVEPVEYIRKDAFIEKACDAYCKVCKMPNCRRNECKMIEDFKKYIEE